jgi:hypothetical protein
MLLQLVLLIIQSTELLLSLMILHIPVASANGFDCLVFTVAGASLAAANIGTFSKDDIADTGFF